MNVPLNEYAWVKVKYGKPDISSTSKGKPGSIAMHEEKNQLSHHQITMLTCQLLDTQQPVNHRSHHDETHPVISGQNTPSQP